MGPLWSCVYWKKIEANSIPIYKIHKCVLGYTLHTLTDRAQLEVSKVSIYHLITKIHIPTLKFTSLISYIDLIFDLSPVWMKMKIRSFYFIVCCTVDVKMKCRCLVINNRSSNKDKCELFQGCTCISYYINPWLILWKWTNPLQNRKHVNSFFLIINYHSKTYWC